MESKTYVNVICSYDTLGNIRPIFVVWDDGCRYKIKRIVKKEKKGLPESRRLRSPVYLYL